LEKVGKQEFQNVLFLRLCY